MSDGSASVPVSVIVLTKDEEVNIRPCLESLAWADEVIVVDSGSRDRTTTLAAETRKDVRLFSHSFQDFGDQRNWALDNTQPRNDWILFVDADERITTACAQAIRKAIAAPGATVGFYLCNRYIFLGRWIRHCTLYPSWQLRLLKKGQVRFRKEGHGQREVTDGPLAYIREPYDHHGLSKGVSEWIARHNVYSSQEVELLLRLRREPIEWAKVFGPDPVDRRRSLKRLAARMPCRALFRFLYMYVVRGGFLDGKPGLVFCRLRMSHEIHIVVKLREAERA